MRNIAIIICTLLPLMAVAQQGRIIPDKAVKIPGEKMDTLHLCGDWIAVGKIENGQKEGRWTYYRGNNMYYAGTYRNDVKQGEWTSEYPHAKLNYKDGLLDGEILYYHTTTVKEGATTFFYESTIIEQRRHYVSGKAHGEWVTYAKDGKTRTEIRHYRNDKPFGVWEIQQGELLYKGPTNEFGNHGHWTTSIHDTIVGGGDYVNGVKEGEWVDLLYPGSKSTGRYVNGKKEGLWRWYSKGQLEMSREFVHDKRHGADTSWDDGHISYITHWHEDRLDGTYTHFFADGNKESEYVYDRVTRNATFRSFDEKGNLLITGQLEINPDFLILEADRENDCSVPVYDEFKLELIELGICWWHCTTSSHAKPDVDLDSTIRYFRSEQFRKDTVGPHAPWNTPMYLRTGVWTEYYPGEKKKEEGMYARRAREDMKTGDVTYLKNGWWRVYEESGTLLREELYENGELVETRNRKK